MKTHFSNFDAGRKAAQQLTVNPPAILFEADKAADKGDMTKTNKEKYRSVEVKIDPNEADSNTVTYHVRIFDNGTPEQFCKLAEQFEELTRVIPLTTVEMKKTMYTNLLKGASLTTFNAELANGRGAVNEAKLKKAIEAVTLKAFNNDTNAYRRQLKYMRYNIHFNKTHFKEFETRLRELNNFLPYFPSPPGNTDAVSLTDDQLVEIIDQAKPMEYQQQLLEANFDPYSNGLAKFALYLERLDASANIEASLNKQQRAQSNAEKGNKKRKASTNVAITTNGPRKPCPHCGKMHKDHDKCWTKKGNEHLNPFKRAKTGNKPNFAKKPNPSFSAEQMTFLINGAHDAALKKAGKKPTKAKKKRKIEWTPPSSEEEGHCIEEILDDSNTHSDSADSSSSE